MARKSREELEQIISNPNIKETENDRLNWIGKIFDSNNCGKFKVLRVYGINKFYNKSYLCEFLNTGYLTIADRSNIKRGNVQDMRKPSFYNKGFIGDYNGVAKHHEFYKLWSLILIRVYDEDVHKKSPKYKGTNMCDRWLDFSKFIEDVPNILGFEEMKLYTEFKFEMDKDILKHNNMVYSLDTCCFIPKKLNTFFINKQITNKTGFEGVGEHNGCYRARVSKDNKSIFIGRFDNPLDAYELYHNKKLEILNYYLNNEFSFLNNNLKNAMYRKLNMQYEETINKNKEC